MAQQYLPLSGQGARLGKELPCQGEELLYSGLGRECSGRHCVYDDAEIFDRLGRGEVGLLRVYYYAERAAKCQELVDMLLRLSLRRGQDQPIVQVSQQADSPGVSPRRDRRENSREHLWGGWEAET